ncbi:hypothetical protein Cassandra_0204 [Pseudomonas phage Cassandra]|nr:hypothetical protein Cassandra_0204 [Pseudomonas phage Cassandra]WPK39400.1 hypothetical protein Deiofobo_0203 [Pseudomonas phage Deifobo]WPK39913.1 hypothetical protein ETTORE_0204 [Pseudomonas phage Ettore]WPK40433.1 hypothetical protein Paride_0203 [Pseudomonas phage Paride]BDR25657.1 hypothetical protein RVBP16_0970 [Pseudomonas phage sp. 30-2]
MQTIRFDIRLLRYSMKQGFCCIGKDIFEVCRKTRISPGQLNLRKNYIGRVLIGIDSNYNLHNTCLVGWTRYKNIIV